MKTPNVYDITPLAEHPEVQAIDEKVNKLRAEITLDTGRIEDLSRPESDTATAVAESVREAAATLLESGEVPEHAVVDRDSALRELYRRRRLRREALRLAEERLRDVRARIGSEVLAAARPAYQALVQEMAPLVYQLAHLVDREQDFRAALSDAGIDAGSIAPVVLAGFGVKDDQSAASRWLAEAMEHHGVQLPELLKLRTQQREHAERRARQDAAELQAKREEEEAEAREMVKRRERAAKKARDQRERQMLAEVGQPREAVR